MGGVPYWYFVPYQPNIQAALDALRAREFKAGRYNPVLPFQRFPVDADSPAPGNKHRTIEAAQEAADADGTRSILDIERIGEEPDFSTAAVDTASTSCCTTARSLARSCSPACHSTRRKNV